MTTVYGAQDDLVFIAHQKLEDNSLTPEDVINIYLGRKSKWQSGVTIVPVQLSETSAASKILLNDFLDFKLREFKEYWRKQLFAGRLLPPIVVSDKKEMLKLVSSELGSIGFLLKSDVTPELLQDSQTKLIQIQD